MRKSARRAAIVMMVAGGIMIGIATSLTLGAGIVFLGIGFVAAADMATTPAEK